MQNDFGIVDKQDKFLIPLTASGEPVIYEKSHSELIIEYFSVEPYTKEMKKNKKGDVYLERVPNSLPTLSKFARWLGVPMSQLYGWAQDHPEFKQAFDTSLEIQKEFLVENGLNGLYNSNFAQFTAKNYTDMRDKTEVDIGGEGVKPFVLCLFGNGGGGVTPELGGGGGTSNVPPSVKSEPNKIIDVPPENIEPPEKISDPQVNGVVDKAKG